MWVDISVGFYDTLHARLEFTGCGARLWSSFSLTSVQQWGCINFIHASTHKNIDCHASNEHSYTTYNSYTIQEKSYPDTKGVKNIHCTHLDVYRVLYFPFFPYMLAFFCLRYITNSYSCILYVLLHNLSMSSNFYLKLRIPKNSDYTQNILNFLMQTTKTITVVEKYFWNLSQHENKK